MSKENEFSKLVDDLDRKFKTIEEKKNRFEKEVKKKAPSKVAEEDKVQKKFRELKEQQKFRVKEKLTAALIVFCVGHALLIPLYLRYPQYFLGMFACASLSLGVICVAIIDYG